MLSNMLLNKVNVELVLFSKFKVKKISLAQKHSPVKIVL